MDGQIAARCWQTIYLRAFLSEDGNTGDRIYAAPIPLQVHMELYTRQVVTARGEVRTSSAKIKTNGTQQVIKTGDQIYINLPPGKPFDLLKILPVSSALFNGYDHYEILIG